MLAIPAAGLLDAKNPRVGPPRSPSRVAGVFGDLIGIREVFVAAGVIVVAGGLLSAALYRGAVSADPRARESTRPDAMSGLEEGVR